MPPDYIEYVRRMVGKNPIIMVATSVSIFDADGRLLLLRRADDGSWGLVGGFMELGEAVEDTARREVYEETGLTVGDMTLFGVFSSMREFQNGDRSQIVTVSYLADEVTGDASVNDAEGLEIGYFDLDTLPENLFEPNLEIFEALRRRSGPNQPSPQKSPGATWNV